MNAKTWRRAGWGCLGLLLLAGCQAQGMKEAKSRDATIAGGAAADRPAAANWRLVAYYFHRTIRCPTCLSLEKQAQDAIESKFSGEIAAGMVEWRSLNIDEPAHQHFEKDYALTAQSLVFVEMDGERQVRWLNLARVWELVEQPPEFRKYVIEEMQGYLNRGQPARTGT
jgi:hypothetical protein